MPGRAGGVPLAGPGVGVPLSDAADAGAPPGNGADEGEAGVAVAEELAAGAVAPFPEVRFTRSIAPGRSDREPPTPVAAATVLPSGGTTETAGAVACDGAPETAAVVAFGAAKRPKGHSIRVGAVTGSCGSVVAARVVSAAGVSAGAGSAAWFDFDQREKRPSPNRWLFFAAGTAACGVTWADGPGATFAGATTAGCAFDGATGATATGAASAWGDPEPVSSGMTGAIGNDDVGGVATGSGCIGSGMMSTAPGAGAELGFGAGASGAGAGGGFSTGAGGAGGVGGTTGAVGAGV